MTTSITIPPAGQGQTATTRQLLTVKQVAETLSCGVSTVWRLVRSGDLPQPIKIGGSTRWRRADIEALTAREAA